MKQLKQGLFVLAVLVLGIGTAPERGGAELAESGCVLEVAGAPKVYAQCSVVEVPFEPDSPEGGTFELFVARIPALSANPQPDPLLLIEGGPGGSTVDMYLHLSATFSPLRRDRDIILVDQRGTGRSAQGFECEIPAAVDLQIANEEFLQALVAECLASLDRDPRFFTTSVAVRDLDAVRRELGVDQWNIYGASYGTRVACDSEAAVIEVDALSKRFGEVSALSEVSFRARDGQITGLLGPNGAGKSTCLRVLSTILKPSDGKARLGGLDITEDRLAVRRIIGTLPHGAALYPHLTAVENIRYFGLLCGVDRTTLSRRIDHLVQRLDLESVADRKVAGFSQGERTKVALARALVHKPPHLLLDEPTNGLDVKAIR